jgi:hypothetical protein
MKSLNCLKNYGLALIAMTLMLTAANAQARYKHVPRVKVDVNRTEKVSIPEETQTAPVVTTSIINAEETKTVATSEATTVNTENTTVASTTEEAVVVTNKTTSVVKNDHIEKVDKKADAASFTKRIKENSKLLDVKEVKKTNMARWVLIMIILLAAAFLFTILAVVFGFTLYFSVLYLIFWILAGLCWLGAFIVLILGLTGVMS